MNGRSVSAGAKRVARRLALAIAFVLAPAALTAQGTLRGVLYDSLLTDRAVANAEVVLLGESRKATTDGNGWFTFTDVAAGTHTVAYWGPWLDTLALPPLQAAIEVRGDGRAVTVRLATPSIATYQRAVCGTVLEDGQGILLGETRGSDGAPAADVGVGARWTETRIGVGMFEHRLGATWESRRPASFP